LSDLDKKALLSRSNRPHLLDRFLSGVKLQQSALFIGGEFDIAVAMNRDLINQLETTRPSLKKAVLLPNTGHWMQTELVAT
jgi:pimeloyl-ACP methyl ester carboxylesterase